MYYKKNHNSGTVTCMLCPHRCVITLGNRGRCGVRENNGGELLSLNYGELTAINIDPIEKKPLFHFMPGSKTLSVGSFGCNFKCPYCQNHIIAFEKPTTKEISPEVLVNQAKELTIPSISYTYNEPTIYYEYIYHTALLAQKNGLKNILVTNGYIENIPLKELLKFIDAVNIDLKAFNNDTYEKICHGSLDPVLRTINKSYQECHMEITVLLVPGMHGELELKKMFQWIAAISDRIPVHLSRYFPKYRYTAPSTSISWMNKVKGLAEEYLKNVYLGNV